MTDLAGGSKNWEGATRELADAKPHVIIAVTQLGALALQKATNTVPIVVTLGCDPVGMGLVESLARPGGNITGHVQTDPLPNLDPAQRRGFRIQQIMMFMN